MLTYKHIVDELAREHTFTAAHKYVYAAVDP